MHGGALGRPDFATWLVEWVSLPHQQQIALPSTTPPLPVTDAMQPLYFAYTRSPRLPLREEKKKKLVNATSSQLYPKNTTRVPRNHVVFPEVWPLG